MWVPRALSIAGSAARGGAGIQADLKTFQEMGVFGLSSVTGIVAYHPYTNQNVFPIELSAIEAQVYTALRDVGVDAIKTGMLYTKENISHVAKWIEEADTTNIVVDPVMVGKMDTPLLKDDAINTLKTKLIPLATIITPNMPEAALLLKLNQQLTTVDDLKLAAIELKKLGSKYVLVKGGRLKGPAVDVLYDGEKLHILEVQRIDTIHTNGAGCSYSAAITALLAKGKPVQEAVKEAKMFITAAIRHSITFKRGVGPPDFAAYHRHGELGVKESIIEFQKQEKEEL
ncbi:MULTISPECIES: bifunctional hydroxymethylpyrimidine kinase/phosphomethylpyrimidine kinase [Cytobacillus]|uniref:bifunctional hydroxymethylpyrimidine kinase/phosphomethylpyrimidine kinase n=1 Tax=Cytobacillus TaxID=2675230 RepID=UPI00207AE9ED|nr:MULTISPECIES: bifunctional hydroxymethylpyrimidine kinase/phosphomethylpyrimidine kinase [Cytobacillus]MED3575397.1 bifunctional hydroxymethylpyrimidine kinase/phosphomethylpyrimidine kinase [Cytobacillus praedii]USK57865.1 bifunctional hydroxymethylpyrimidine kinase/phosphomethylpyrimidine kinase [Cytobacillus solani]